MLNAVLIPLLAQQQLEAQVPVPAATAQHSGCFGGASLCSGLPGLDLCTAETSAQTEVRLPFLYQYRNKKKILVFVVGNIMQ